MMISVKRLIRQLALPITCSLLSSCGNTPQTHYYVLSSPPDAAGTVPPSSRMTASLVDGATLGVGPITVADYLNRAQITLSEGNVLRLEPFHRWGEPLDAGISRVLYENLSYTLGARSLVQFPWRSDEIPTLQLRVHVVQLNRVGDRAQIKATWVLAGGPAGTGGYRDTFDAEAALRDAEFDSLAAAYSTLLQQLANQIAKRVPGAVRAIIAAEKHRESDR